MSQPFPEQVTPGGILIFPQIQSPNFAHNVAGWKIARDGSAEFNNVTIRSGAIISGTALYYSSSPPAANTLVASVSATAGTDPYGNDYLAGQVTYHYTGAGPSGSLAVAVSDAGIAWYAAASGTLGPWTKISSFASYNVVPGVFLTAPAFEFISSSDGNAYQVGQLSAPATAVPETINQTSAQTITGCTANLGARAYRVKAVVQFTANAAAGNPSFQLGVSAVTSQLWGNAIIWQTTGAGAGANRFDVDTAGAVFQGPGMVAGAVYLVQIDAYMVCTSAGAVSLQAFTSAAADTFTVNNAVLDVIPV